MHAYYRRTSFSAFTTLSGIYQIGTMRNFYEILGVAESATPEELKKAYHKALLEHHPDKQQQQANGTIVSAQKAVQDIKLAYATLTDDNKRQDYIERLRTATKIQDRGDVVDLGDMTVREGPDQTSEWTWPCRCGEQDGYVVTEQDLEDNLDLEEVAVQCIGCSLWITVQYQEA